MMALDRGGGCGHWGSGAEYPMPTLAHLEDIAIHDRHLWKTQTPATEKITATTEG